MSKLLTILAIFISLLIPITTTAQSEAFTIKSIKLITTAQKVSSDDLKANSNIMDNTTINQGDDLCGNGNAYIAGHSSPTKRKQKAGRVFANLHKVKRGDIVTSKDCKYEVRSVTILTGTANSDGISYHFTNKQGDFILDNTFDEGTLTLQTCTKKLGQIVVIKAIKL
jgi:sortase (surface protein transpeptidase)